LENDSVAREEIGACHKAGIAAAYTNLISVYQYYVPTIGISKIVVIGK
jgi:hypothetical protein